MSKNIKGTQTEINLMAAFAGESQARNRYNIAAKVAKAEGFEKVAYILDETADQERQHAKRLFSFLEGGEVLVKGAFPAGIVGSIQEHLKSAAAGEHFEWTEMYPNFAKTAEEEGFKQLAVVFKSIGVAEEHHEKRFLRYLKEIKEGTMFKRNESVTWRCRKCGFICNSKDAACVCPACAHETAYFEVLNVGSSLL